MAQGKKKRIELVRDYSYLAYVSLSNTINKSERANIIMVLCFLAKSNLKNMLSPGQVYKRSFQPRIFQLCSNTLNYLRADSRKEQLFQIL